MGKTQGKQYQEYTEKLTQRQICKYGYRYKYYSHYSYRNRYRCIAGTAAVADERKPLYNDTGMKGQVGNELAELVRVQVSKDDKQNDVSKEQINKPEWSENTEEADNRQLEAVENVVQFAWGIAKLDKGNLEVEQRDEKAHKPEWWARVIVMRTATIAKMIMAKVV